MIVTFTPPPVPSGVDKHEVILSSPLGEQSVAGMTLMNRVSVEEKYFDAGFSLVYLFYDSHGEVIAEHFLLEEPARKVMIQVGNPETPEIKFVEVKPPKVEHPVVITPEYRELRPRMKRAFRDGLHKLLYRGNK